MGRITSLLDNIDVNNQNTDELYEIFRLVPDSDYPLLRFCLFPGTVLIRQRINLPKTDFCKISELGYPPADCIHSYERANVPYQSMFYACSFPRDYDAGCVDSPPPRLVALMETSSFFKDSQASGIERCTVSRWDVVKDLELVAMPFLYSYSRACKDILTINDAWNREISKYDVNQEGLELVEYMAREIGKPFSSNLEYFKISNFVNYLLHINKKTKNVDGIIYPSVPAEGSGFNIALKPDSVKEKVQFKGASLCYLLKRKEQASMFVLNHSISISGARITYSPKQIDAKEEARYKEFAEGLSFRN